MGRSPARLLASAAFLFLSLLAGCAPAPLPEATSFAPPSPSSGAPRSCQETLRSRGAVFEQVADQIGSGSCRLTDGIRLERTTLALDQPVTLSCPLAERLVRFENEVLQPLARRHLGRPVVTINSFGAYDCRRIRRTGRLSEHARGRAIDIAGFDLEGGRTISVKRDWRGKGAASRFLQELARAACRHFAVVLSPKSDRDHHDHLHLDIGPRPYCGG